MGLVVNVNSIRSAWMNAKKELFNSRRAAGAGPKMYWAKLAEENKMTVVISGYNGSFPVIDVVEFDDEQSYTWFMLKWA